LATPTAPPSAHLAAVVLARDEAANIGRCLDALAWADDLLVLVDSATTDRTADLAASAGARLAWRPFDDYAGQRNAAMALVQTPWLLFVDADEVVTPALAAEIRAVLAEPGDRAGFWIPRRNFICGRWVRHAGWYPDEQLRLLCRERARYDPARPVHELVLLDGPAGHLREPLIHFNYATLAEFRAKQSRYARLEAQRLHRDGLRPRPHNYVVQPLRELRRRFLTLQGYREGLLGLQLSLLLAWSTFETYRELRRLWRTA
jgi:glycosyltransferase involved in cell wall biosynthesis